MDNVPAVSIALRAYREVDRQTFIAWCADAEAFRFLLKSYPHTSGAEELFANFLVASTAGVSGRLVWAVAEDLSGNLIGHLELKITEKTMAAEGELVAFVAPARRGRGIASAATTLVVRSPWLAPEFHHILAVCQPGNVGSIRILHKAGFTAVSARSPSASLWFRRAFSKPPTAA